MIRLMRVPAAALLVSACGAAPVPGPETVVCSCEYAIAERGTSGAATIELQGKTITGIDVLVVYPGLPGRPGYSCTLVVTGDDPATRWSRREATTEIVFPGEPGGPEDVVVITERGGEYVVDLVNTRSSGHCGAGAELPARLTIPRAGGTCGVTL